MVLHTFHITCQAIFIILILTSVFIILSWEKNRPRSACHVMRARGQWSVAGHLKKMPLLCLLWCYITATLFALSPARNGKQWAGCVTHSSARLAKSAAVFHAIVPHNRRIIRPTVTHSSQSGSHKRTPSCVDKRNVGYKGSTSTIWLMHVRH